MDQSDSPNKSSKRSFRANSTTVEDAVDSIRLTKRTYRHSAPTMNFDAEQSMYSIADIDIDALDAEFERLSFDIKGQIAALRQNPNNLTLRHTLTSTKAALMRIKTWSSLVHTADGFDIVKKNLMEQHEQEVNQRKFEVDELLKISKAQSTADVCFLMDCTGSMRKYLDATKTQIRHLTQAIVQLFATKPHLAFIGYRDVHESLEKLDFTDNENVFQDFLKDIHAVGGDDTCEDVFSMFSQCSFQTRLFINCDLFFCFRSYLGGLEVVSQLSWTSSNRILIHICDAPCHGQDYHDFQGRDNDNYLKGDPKNRDLTKLIISIKRLGITYCKIQLNETTKKMFDEFSFIYGSISEIQVDDPACLIERVIEKTSAIIQSHIASTLSSYHHANRLMKSYSISTREPDWNSIEMYDVTVTEIVPPETFEEIFYPLTTNETKGRMKIAANPFTKGSLRFAFYGQFSNDDFVFVDAVYKELVSIDSKTDTFLIYREHLEMQAIAQFLAEQFNFEQQRLFRNFTPIVYADADIVQQITNPSKIYQVERRMHQEWRKWNNNNGGVSLNEYSTLLQAFSHWTYQVTCGRLMVVDLQGVKIDRAYLLTDPALHCDDLLRFRETRTNLGVKGMHQFFRTHVCSDVCTKLNLSSSSSILRPAVFNYSDSILCHASIKTTDNLTTETFDDKEFEKIEKDQLETIENFEIC